MNTKEQIKNVELLENRDLDKIYSELFCYMERIIELHRAKKTNKKNKELNSLLCFWDNYIENN